MAAKCWNGWEGFKERLGMAQGLVNRVVITQRLDSITSDIFSNLIYSLCVSVCKLCVTMLYQLGAKAALSSLKPGKLR